jgi:hypothetical protein
MIEATPHLAPKPIGAGPSGRGLHGLGPASKPGASAGFGIFLMMLAAPPLALGLWVMAQGLVTLTWPRADGQIVRVHFSQSQPDEETRRMSASIDITYRYVVDGRTYSSSSIAPYTFGWQNSGHARKQHDRYSGDMVVKVAYDPSDPSVAYLEPGPSSTSLMLLGVGFIFGLPGLFIWRLAVLERRAAARREAA